MVRTFTAAVIAVACLWLPGAAAANSGSITSVAPIAGGQFTATYTTTSDRCDPGDVYCGWFPYATQVGPNEACDAYNTTNRLTYVGQPQDQPGTQGPTAATFYPNFKSAFKICLHISYGASDEVNVGEVVYTPPAPTPTPQAVPPMSVSKARSLLSQVLRRKYGARYTRRTSRLHRSCYRLTTQKVRCRVSWNTKRYRYSGKVTLRNDPADPARRFIYSVSIQRKRRHAVASPPARSSCDTNYAGACLKPNVSDYDCAGGSGDGPYYTGPVRVVGNDHYGLDRDSDGSACDT